MKRPRILKRHAGRPIDFSSKLSGLTIRGRILTVGRTHATIHYYGRTLPRPRAQEAPDGFIAYLPVRSDRIVEIY